MIIKYVLIGKMLEKGKVWQFQPFHIDMKEHDNTSIFLLIPKFSGKAMFFFVIQANVKYHEIPI